MKVILVTELNRVTAYTDSKHKFDTKATTKTMIRTEEEQ
jgi:hypothetical protein